MMRSGRVITVFGARGNIGKTVLATNLAVAIAQETGQRVALADLHLRFGDVAILLDLPVERSISDLALSEHELTADALTSCLHTYRTGIRVLPAPIKPSDWRHISTKHVERIVSLLSETHDYVVLDTGSVPCDEIMASALKGADVTLLVTTAHEASLNDASRLMNIMRSWGFDAGGPKPVLVATNEATELEVEDVERALGLQIVCSVPYDRNISAAIRLGTPVVASHPHSSASESIVALARTLARPDHLKSPIAEQMDPPISTMKRLVCLFLGHDWELGWAGPVVPFYVLAGRPPDRMCRRCSKVELA